MADFFRAMATLGHQLPDGVGPTLRQFGCTQLAFMSPRDVSLTLWSLVLLKLIDLEACMFCYRVLSNVDLTDYKPRDFARLHHAQLLLEAGGKVQQRREGGAPGVVLLPPRVIATSAGAWKEAVGKHKASGMSMEISSTLVGMGVAHEVEVAT